MHNTHLFRNSILFILIPFFLQAQKITEKPIASLTISNLSEIYDFSFSTNGNYCLKVNKGKTSYFYTNKGILGPFSSIKSTFLAYSSLEFNDYDDNESTPWYYKNPDGATVYGPVNGRMLNFFTSYENASLIVTRNDSLIYYINGKLIDKRAATKEMIKNSHFPDLWCAFSRNGNTLYTLTQNGVNHLYKNGELIASSPKKDFSELHINDAGQYTYAAGHKPAEENKEYDSMFFVTTKEASLGPVRTVWENYLDESGAYYYYGDDNVPYYMAVNNQLFKNISEPTVISIPDNKNFALVKPLT